MSDAMLAVESLGAWYGAARILFDLALQVGASLAYSIGYFGRIELIRHHGAKVHITPARLEREPGVKAPICRLAA